MIVPHIAWTVCFLNIANELFFFVVKLATNPFDVNNVVNKWKMLFREMIFNCLVKLDLDYSLCDDNHG